MKSRVLLLEDTREIQIVVREALSKICEVVCVENILDAEKEISAGAFDLLILDIGLPDGCGMDLCRKIRSKPELSNIPIIFFTGRTEVDDLVEGFNIGADDYLTKPLEPRVFMARVKAKLQRSKEVTAQTQFQTASFTVDLKAQKAVQTIDGQPIELSLTPIEFKFLVHFLKNQNRIFAREELVTEIWGSNVHIAPHTVDTHISSLRKKIGPASTHIKSVIKKGFCFSLN